MFLPKLERENARWVQASNKEIEHSTNVAEGAPPAIDVRFGPQASCEVHQQISRHLVRRFSAAAGALAHQINRIGNLGVAKANARLSARFDTKMHPASGWNLHDAPMTRQ